MSVFFLSFGPRFPATVDTYDRDLRDLAKKIAVELGLGSVMREGTYAMIGGPTFETVAESRLLRLFGADAVGEISASLFVDLKKSLFIVMDKTNEAQLNINTSSWLFHEADFVFWFTWLRWSLLLWLFAVFQVVISSVVYWFWTCNWTEAVTIEAMLINFPLWAVISLALIGHRGRGYVTLTKV